MFYSLENELVHGGAYGFGHRVGHGVHHELSHSQGGGYGMDPGRSHGHGGGHDKSHEVDHRRGCQGRHRGRGSMDIDWIMQGTLEKEISQKKAIMEEKAVAIKWVKMGFQKVFRELAMEMIDLV